MEPTPLGQFCGGIGHGGLRKAAGVGVGAGTNLLPGFDAKVGVPLGAVTAAAEAATTDAAAEAAAAAAEPEAAEPCKGGAACVLPTSAYHWGPGPMVCLWCPCRYLLAH